ncbi:MAG: YfhO family protein [Bacteroidetes bacterium]|nr:YfhO family protein [Bacteroidota bacterium]
MIYEKQKFPFRTLLILIVVAIIAYWPISFMNSCLKWDMIDVVLPFRYFAGECWNEGILPLWNPYQQMGYPIYADMQCPSWYPETILVGIFSGYTNYTLHFLFIIYLVIGGWGVYNLAKYFGTNEQASLISGIAFILSGFFVGHAQALFALISAVWIPYILLNYFRFNEEGKIRHVIKASIFMFLLISNGYQTFTIILSYVLLAILFYFLLRELRLMNWRNIGKQIGLNFLFLVFTLLLSSVSIISIIQMQGLTEIADGISLQSALINPLTPQSLVSLLIPFATVKNPSFFNTDLSMANIYIGLIMLIFSISFLLRKNKIKYWLILLLSLFCLLASFGEYLPIRKFLYDYFPLMNLFRFPSYFSYFTQLAFLIFAGLGLSRFLKSPETEKKKLFWISMPILIVLLFSIAWSSFQIEIRDFSFIHISKNFHETLGKSTFWEHVLLHSLIQLVFLSLFILLIHANHLLKLRLIMLLIVLEMIVSVQLNIFYTGVSHKKPEALKEHIEQLPQGFPIPHGEIINQNDGSRVSPPIWRNTGIFHKEIHYNAFSSFWLKSYNELFEKHPNLSKASLNNELVFMTDQIFPMDSLVDSLITLTDHKKIFIKDNVDDNKSLPSVDDTAFITSFSPNRIEIKVNSKSPQFLCLLQSYYPGWTVTVNSETDKINQFNILYMAVQIPEGSSTIVFEYKNPFIKASFIFSYSFFALLLIILGWAWFLKRKSQNG